MKNTFRVYLPKWHYKLTLIGSLILSMVPIIFCLVNGIDLACITVREDTITVNPGIGKNYSFNINEITKVIRKVNLNTSLDTLVKITVYTKSKHVSVEYLMIGSDKFDRYIIEKIDPEKISTKVRVFKNKQ